MKRYADRCRDRETAMRGALDRLVAVCREHPDVRAAYVFGSYARGIIGPASDLDVLLIRDTAAAGIERVADISLAARGPVPFDFIVVTPDEFRERLPTTTFGRTILATAKLVYAA